MEQQSEELSQSSEELNADMSKEWEMPSEPVTKLGVELKKATNQNVTTSDIEDCDRLEEQQPIGVMSEESQSARVAVSPAMNPQQQPYIQYQHSYQYLQMCDPSNNSYTVKSPTLVHNYPRKSIWLEKL